MNYDVFHYVWWDQELFPALCELPELVPLILCDGSLLCSALDSFLTSMSWGVLSWRLKWDPLQISKAHSISMQLSPLHCSALWTDPALVYLDSQVHLLNPVRALNSAWVPFLSTVTGNSIQVEAYARLTSFFSAFSRIIFLHWLMFRLAQCFVHHCFCYSILARSRRKAGVLFQYVVSVFLLLFQEVFLNYSFSIWSLGLLFFSGTLMTYELDFFFLTLIFVIYSEIFFFMSSIFFPSLCLLFVLNHHMLCLFALCSL